jgi:hypothetical protein
MRAMLLLAAVVAVSCLAGQASAQGVFGTIPATKSGANLPNYARPDLNLQQATSWTQRLMNLIPGFRNNAPYPGSITDFPNPDTNPVGYLQGFGYRRLR